MTKEVKFEDQIAEGAENISVLSMPGDRIIFEPVRVKPKSTSQIIDPQTNEPYEKPDFDRWPIRGKVKYVGKDIPEKHPGIEQGSMIFLEDINAIRGIDINGKHHGLTRLSNVLLVYEDY